jgi:Na+-transporting methylmalonyl-CoA/oxaloacetate decarboxylase gamma subunit
MERSRRQKDVAVSNEVLLARLESQWKTDLEGRKKWQKYVYDNWMGYAFYDSERWDGLLDILMLSFVDRAEVDKIDERMHLFQFFVSAGLALTAIGIALQSWQLDIVGMAMVFFSVCILAVASKLTIERRHRNEAALNRLPSMLEDLKRQHEEFKSLKSQFDENAEEQAARS